MSTEPAGQARVFPAVSTPRAPGGAALCVSGGGSRALSAALGAFSGLAGLADPDNPGRTLLERFDYLSSVSGGSWASVIFTYAPESITDDQLLITPVAPGALVKAGDATPPDILHIDPGCIGAAPQRFSIRELAKLLVEIFEWGMLDTPAKRPWLWIIAVGELVLKPYDLYDASYDKRKDFPEPARTFAASVDQITTDIVPRNPGLSVHDFHVMPARLRALRCDCGAKKANLVVGESSIGVAVDDQHAD